MIVYNSRAFGTFWQLKGSILPRGSLFALPPALFALVLRMLVDMDVVSLESIPISSDGSVYSGFTFVLGFTLVFRTQQSYQRYWQAATSIHEMRSEWYDCCASLVVFARNSDRPFKEVIRFEHLIVRLFSLLNAAALLEIADLSEEDFPLIDIEGLSKEALSYLCSPLAQGRKTEIVFQWIKSSVCLAMKANMIGVPPPILTRVFQELGAGLTKYHDAVQILIWPFPFPYAQLCVGLINLHMVLTPILFSKVATHAIAAFTMTFVAILSIKGLDVIAGELENPFGSDANDLPCLSMHRDMNSDLILLLDERTWAAPTLTNQAETSVHALYDMNRNDNEHIEFNDISTAGFCSKFVEACQKKARHHDGADSGEHLSQYHDKTMDLLHVRSHVESNSFTLQHKATGCLTPDGTVRENPFDVVVDVKSKSPTQLSSEPAQEKVKEKMTDKLSTPALEHKSKDSDFTWREFMSSFSAHMQQLLQNQHEQSLIAQDALLQRLEGRLDIPSLAAFPAKFNRGGRYAVPPQPRPVESPQLDALAVLMSTPSRALPSKR